MDKEWRNVLVLDNGDEYTEINRLTHDDKTFIFLSNLENPSDFCIKKLIVQDGKEYIDRLDSTEQFDELFRLFSQKMIS